jgi:hypothetical protein
MVRLVKRVGAALLAGAVLFAVDASAAGLRPCPHHDHVPAQQSDHHSHSSPDATPDTPGHDDGPCSCLSGAQCSVPAALPQSNATALMAAAAVTHSAAARLVHQTAARSPHLFLPEATAPPVVL